MLMKLHRMKVPAFFRQVIMGYYNHIWEHPLDSSPDETEVRTVLYTYPVVYIEYNMVTLNILT